MNLKEMMNKTGCVVVGIAKSVNEFTSQKSGITYYSVDLIVQGSRSSVNIKLPENYDRSKFKEYELAKVECFVKEAYGGRGVELVAM